eukprot:TRINITY_DN4937_c0_g1_i3.p1 TRINITY_DN4937_c0_g1~~TRINITY_DN4937_c0_g1_i3.p1  ORF type:complete len:153 (+),score=13.63 TRINITY_DN4937_c0_g1_i3:205-663(+)
MFHLIRYTYPSRSLYSTCCYIHLLYRNTDLAVYMRDVDLTGPVRKCGLEEFISKKWSLDCLAKIGFTPACSEVWFYDILSTRKNCLFICLWDLPDPYNDPKTCALNACLECDEMKSGPIFKIYSGRTRRNSGLYSAIYRPPNTIYDVVHDYY